MASKWNLQKLNGSLLITRNLEGTLAFVWHPSTFLGTREHFCVALPGFNDLVSKQVAVSIMIGQKEEVSIRKMIELYSRMVKSPDLVYLLVLFINFKGIWTPP